MDFIELAVKERKDEKPRRLRREGMIPGVLYGLGQAGVKLQFDEKDFSHRISHEASNNAVWKLKGLSDSGEQAVMIWGIQKHPVHRAILHVDFKRINMSDKVDVSISLSSEGQAAGTKEGGILTFLMHEIEVKCLPNAIPDEIKVDVSALRIGDVLTAGDLVLPEGVELSGEELTRALITVSPPAVEEVVAEEGAPAAGEPEVIGKPAEDEAGKASSESKGSSK